jgi:hypothetical protein
MCDECDDDKSEYLPTSGRVTNLLFLIDELGLNQLELSDLSAGVYNRMNIELPIYSRENADEPT